MSSWKKDKENIRTKLDKGIFKTCPKPNTATVTWWNNFFRIQDDNDHILPYVQCIKCLSILSYDVNKTGSSTHKAHAESCFGGTNPSGSKSQDIITMMNKQKHVPFETKRLFADACATFCSYDLRPYEIVNGNGFELLCQSLLDIAYKSSSQIKAKDLICDSTTVSRHVKKRRVELIETLLSDLNVVKLFGISTDYWKNKFTSDSYLTTTLHYDKDGHMKNIVLKTVLFDESKTGANTKKMIWNILKSFGIDPDLFHIIYVTDNGSNLISALNGEAHIRCVCHCVNLVIKQALEECLAINLLISQCRDLVSHFKRCELQNKLPLTLKQDICTRWNSTYDTLWSIWLSFDDVEQILDTRNEMAHLEKIDRYLIKDITDLLGIFKIGSEKLSADHVPTLHSVLPWFHKLKKTCEPKDTDRLHIRQLKQKILDKLDNKIWLTDIHYIATFLHPETKSLSTLSQSDRNGVIQSVRKIMKTIGIVDVSNDLTLFPDSVKKKNRNKRAKRDDISVHDVLKEFVSNSTDDEDDNKDYDEVVEYMKLKINYPEGEGILVWWKKHSAIFPQLSRLALSLLSIPASSAASERVFSETGRILEARRQQLHPESLDSLVFLLQCTATQPFSVPVKILDTEKSKYQSVELTISEEQDIFIDDRTFEPIKELYDFTANISEFRIKFEKFTALHLMSPGIFNRVFPDNLSPNTRKHMAVEIYNPMVQPNDNPYLFQNLSIDTLKLYATYPFNGTFQQMFDGANIKYLRLSGVDMRSDVSQRFTGNIHRLELAKQASVISVEYFPVYPAHKLVINAYYVSEFNPQHPSNYKNLDEIRVYTMYRIPAKAFHQYSIIRRLSISTENDIDPHALDGLDNLEELVIEDTEIDLNLLNNLPKLKELQVDIKKLNEESQCKLIEKVSKGELAVRTNPLDEECTCITAYLNAALGETPCDAEECENSACFVIKQNYDAKTHTFKTPLSIPRSDGTNALRKRQERVYTTPYLISSEDQDKFRKGVNYEKWIDILSLDQPSKYADESVTASENVCGEELSKQKTVDLDQIKMLVNLIQKEMLDVHL
ncbi:unnamed protein product [Adineta ricciae]|uniref:HAT C-terminal dimerisation domain-containing protein n=1 Tax=Adineta ricciae TaxID=249248 RepID=A0A814Z5I5_ADIRI|nr:unnamed protein product [Adineta ricciae]